MNINRLIDVDFLTTEQEGEFKETEIYQMILALYKYTCEKNELISGRKSFIDEESEESESFSAFLKTDLWNIVFKTKNNGISFDQRYNGFRERSVLIKDPHRIIELREILDTISSLPLPHLYEEFKIIGFVRLKNLWWIHD